MLNNDYRPVNSEKKIVASIKNGSVKLSSSPSFPEKVTWRNIHMDISPYYSWAILCDWNSMIFISWYRNSYNGKISTLILQWVPEMRPIILQWHYKKHIWYFFPTDIQRVVVIHKTRHFIRISQLNGFRSIDFAQWRHKICLYFLFGKWDGNEESENVAYMGRVTRYWSINCFISANFVTRVLLFVLPVDTITTCNHQCTNSRVPSGWYNVLY